MKLISVSEIGPGHLSDGLPNQDYANHMSQKGCWIVAVADGMGSRIHSAHGSKLAVKSIFNIIRHSPKDINDKELITEIYRSWLNGINDLKIAPSDAVTTVLFAWGNNQGGFRYAQLGDGTICSSNGLLIVDTQSSYSNETTGLGISRKFSDWKCGKAKLRPGDILILMTDGISEDLLDPFEFVNGVREYAGNKPPRRIKSWLKGELKNWHTPCHTDDKSLSMVVSNEKK